DISQNGRAAQGVRLMRLGNEQFVSTVAKVQNDSEDDEQSEAMTDDDNKLTNDSEEVIENSAPGDAIHTEAPEAEHEDNDNTSNDDR
ncbi:hypothetical protein QP635_11925, partial [Staphylococcus hominis]